MVRAIKEGRVRVIPVQFCLLTSNQMVTYNDDATQNVRSNEFRVESGGAYSNRYNYDYG
jgi:hypothetical protein